MAGSALGVIFFSKISTNFFWKKKKIRSRKEHRIYTYARRNACEREQIKLSRDDAVREIKKVGKRKKLYQIWKNEQNVSFKKSRIRWPMGWLALRPVDASVGGGDGRGSPDWSLL